VRWFGIVARVRAKNWYPFNLSMSLSYRGVLNKHGHPALQPSTLPRLKIHEPISRDHGASEVATGPK